PKEIPCRSGERFASARLVTDIPSTISCFSTFGRPFPIQICFADLRGILHGLRRAANAARRRDELSYPRRANHSTAGTSAVRRRRCLNIEYLLNGRNNDDRTYIYATRGLACT